MVTLAASVFAQGAEATASALEVGLCATDWDGIWDFVDEVEDVVPGEPSVSPGTTNPSTEGGNLEKVVDQADRFQELGLRENCTVPQRLSAKLAIEAIRLEMLANPAEFLEPEWEGYAITLDLIEEALDASEDRGS